MSGTFADETRVNHDIHNNYMTSLKFVQSNDISLMLVIKEVARNFVIDNFFLELVIKGFRIFHF